MDNESTLKILIVAAEVAPFAKVGGMADVAGALPQALWQLGHDVRVALPKYAMIDDQKYGLSRPGVQFDVPMGEGQEHAVLVEGKLGNSVPAYMIANEEYFGREKVYGYPDDDRRFVFFSRAVLEMLKSLDWQPDVIHCNDWHTAIIADYLKTLYAADPFFAGAASAYTIHNLAYQGIFPADLLKVAGLERWGLVCEDIPEYANLVDLMARGICYADVVNTVSERYAQEILTPEYGEKLDGLLQKRREHLFGIINGIDTTVFDPATDKYIAANFDVNSIDQRVANKLNLQETVGLPVDASAPLIGMVSRLAEQKGFDLLEQVIGPALRYFKAQLVLLGTGEPLYEEIFRRLAVELPQQAAVMIRFDAGLAQKIYAGSDMFLMPSKFEPCGLGQMIAMRYGNVPVVRQTGGLADTVQDYDPGAQTGSGFVFAEYSPLLLFGALSRAMESYKYRSQWRELMIRDMRADYSWNASARKYVDLYRKALTFHTKERIGS
jgi:starch synthase